MKKYTDFGHYIVKNENGSCIPACAGNSDYQQFQQWLADIDPATGQLNVPELPPPPTAAEAQPELSLAVQNVLDAGARFLEYGNIQSLCSYDNSTDPIFRAQALAAIAWRDAVWAHCRSVRAAVLAGTRPLPTKNELLAELPVRPW